MTTARRVGARTLPDLPPTTSPPPHVTAETRASVGRIATDTVNLSLLQMMENAGRGGPGPIVELNPTGGAEPRP